MMRLKGFVFVLLISAVFADYDEVNQTRSATTQTVATPMLVKPEEIEVAKKRLIGILPELDEISQTRIMRVLLHLIFSDRVEAVKELKIPVTLRIENSRREASIKYFLSEISRSLKLPNNQPIDQFRVNRNLFAEMYTQKCSKNTIYIYFDRPIFVNGKYVLFIN